MKKSMPIEIKECRILGSRIHLVDIDQVLSIMEDWIQNFPTLPFCRQVVVTGFHGLWEAKKNNNLKKNLNSADLWIPDGKSATIIARLKGHRNAPHLAGEDLMRAFLKLGSRKNYKSFFYGDTDQTLTKLQDKIVSDFPNHIIAGAYSPPFRPLTEEEDHQIVQMINASRADVLWIGLGCPKQDRWIYEHKARLNVPVAVGVGAAFSFLAGTVQRSPRAITRLGLEWLWRLAKEPKKMWRRDFIDGPQFIVWAFMEILSDLAKKKRTPS